MTNKGGLLYDVDVKEPFDQAVQPEKYGMEEALKTLRFALVPGVLFLLAGIGQAGWFWVNPRFGPH